MLIFFETKTKKGVVIKNLDDAKYLSQIEFQKVEKEFKANKLLNLTTAVSEMKQILTKDYSSQQEFDYEVDICIKRLEYTNLDYEKVVNAQQIIKI